MGECGTLEVERESPEKREILRGARTLSQDDNAILWGMIL
jgi:hypothetical protein